MTNKNNTKRASQHQKTTGFIPVLKDQGRRNKLTRDIKSFTPNSLFSILLSRAIKGNNNEFRISLEKFNIPILILLHELKLITCIYIDSYDLQTIKMGKIPKTKNKKKYARYKITDAGLKFTPPIKIIQPSLENT